MGVNVYKYYQSAPPIGKIAIIGVSIVGIATAYLVGKSIVRRIQHQKDLKGQRQAVDDSKGIVKVLEQQGKGPTYPDAQYSTWASAIQTAFEGCDPGNDDMAAMANAVNASRNEADIYKLIATFSVRKWDECGWLTGDVGPNGQGLDLAGGVRNELNQAQINTLNTILRNKGIVYQF